MDFACSTSPEDILAAQVIKHSFVLISTHPDWISTQAQITVNDFLQISHNDSQWHGSALYSLDGGGAQWELTFHFNGNVDKMKKLVFKQIKNTTSFMHLNDNRAYHAMLIPMQP
jgi:hypothetical protein